MGRCDEALADYSRAIELDPGFQWAIVNRGVTYRQMRRFDEALADLNRAVELEAETSVRSPIAARPISRWAGWKRHWPTTAGL